MSADEELMPVDWRTLEPLEQDALALAGGECDTLFEDWFNARWTSRIPVWAMPPHDAPSDCLRLHPLLWDEWVARYWGTLTPEDRRAHPAWKAAEGYAEERAWYEAEAAKAEGPSC